VAEASPWGGGEASLLLLLSRGTGMRVPFGSRTVQGSPGCAGGKRKEPGTPVCAWKGVRTWDTRVRLCVYVCACVCECACACVHERLCV